MDVNDYSHAEIATIEAELKALPASSYALLLNGVDNHIYTIGTLSLENTGAQTAVVNLILVSNTGAEYKLNQVSLATNILGQQAINKILRDFISLQLLITVASPPTNIKFHLDFIDYTL